MSYRNADNTIKVLTKREYFAGLAMQGMWANADLTQANNRETRGNPDLGAAVFAAMACIAADALLRELGKDPTP